MVSIFTTITDPERRGDHYLESIHNYLQFADQVVIIDGSEKPHKFSDKRIKVVHYPWPKEFHWKHISEAFQKGYDESDGDWVFHMDLDYFFHPNYFDRMHNILQIAGNTPAFSFLKYQFIMPDRFQLKSRLVLAVNKGVYGDRIKFDGGGEMDLCQPSLDGKYIDPGEIAEMRVPFFNYEKTTKTKAQVMEDCGRMDRAYYKQFGEYQLSKDGTDESAFEGYIKMLKGRLAKPHKTLKLTDHPIEMQIIIKGLTKDQLGYSLFGEEVNKYV